jgi:hypothetical protein
VFIARLKKIRGKAQVTAGEQLLFVGVGGKIIDKKED